MLEAHSYITGGETIFKNKCELGWPFHPELGMGNPLPFHQSPSHLLGTQKERVIPRAETPTPLHPPQHPAPEHRESKLKPEPTSPRKTATADPRGCYSESPVLFFLARTGKGLGKKEVPIILPGCTESPENDQINNVILLYG